MKSPADKHHGPRRRMKIGRVDAMPFFFLHHHGTNISFDIRIGGAIAQKTPQIVIVLAEKAGAKFSICRQADPRTMSAERLRDRRDQTNLSRRAVGEAIFACGLALFMRNLLERRARANSANDSTSSSLMPRTSTALIFAGASREDCTASMPRITLAKDLVRVMRSKRSGCKESRLILMRRSPLASKRSTRSDRRCPFVVMERSRTPSACKRAI